MQNHDLDERSAEEQTPAEENAANDAALAAQDASAEGDPSAESDASAKDEAPEEDLESQDILDQKVFNSIPRIQFWGAAGGVGVGYILSGFFNMLNIPWLKSEFIPIIACAVLGYWLGGKSLRKQRAEAAAKAEAEVPESAPHEGSGDK